MTVTLNGNGVFLESDLGAPANIVTLSLLPGVYTLQADADVQLVNLGGPAAARLLGSGVLDFEITPAAVPEPAAWPLIVTALGALGARRDPVMRLVAWRCRGRVT